MVGEEIYIKVPTQEYKQLTAFKRDVELLEQMINGNRTYVDSLFRTLAVSQIAKEYFYMKKTQGIPEYEN